MKCAQLIPYSECVTGTIADAPGTLPLHFSTSKRDGFQQEPLLVNVMVFYLESWISLAVGSMVFTTK